MFSLVSESFLFVRIFIISLNQIKCAETMSYDDDEGSNDLAWVKRHKLKEYENRFLVDSNNADCFETVK